MTTSPSSFELTIDPTLIRKYDLSGPRYTSYPTADRFADHYSAAKHLATLDERAATDPATGEAAALSVYVHLPFCDTICFYCGCNKITTRDHGRSAKYLRYLAREIALTTQAMHGRRKVTQLHLGGGTPTFLSSEELRTLMAMLSEHLELVAGEYSIEIDPRSVDTEKIQTLAKLGFNRISVGVQDFDPAVQKAVNRIQSEEVTVAAINDARANGMTSVNIDLIYGLPQQNVIGFHRTLDRVIEIKPDRIALYSYAHLPTVFKPQRRIVDAQLPTADVKLQLLRLATRKLQEAGYVYIGMDHFALPHDSLAIAARDKTLHRNFQGYSTQADCDLLAFGISAISKVGATYSQNVRTLEAYYERLDQDQLPVMRGYALDADDVLRRDVISAIMCDFALSIPDIERKHQIEFKSYFSREWAQLDALEADGLISRDDAGIEVTAAGRLLVRAVAMVFDKHLQMGREAARFSKVI